MRRVLSEIRDKLLAREVLGITARNGIVGEPGESAHRMEMEPVVSPCPGAAQLIILLENDRLDSTPLERARGGQTRCSPADDDDRGLWQKVSSVKNELLTGDDEHQREQLPQHRCWSTLASITRADPAAEHGGGTPDR